MKLATTTQLIYLLFVLSFFGCDTKKNDFRDRPQNPWVFRSVLDSQARILTVALDEKVWVAYNTENGVLQKIWNGGVNFVGAVYNTNHGPQPESFGNTWVINELSNPWKIIKNGQEFEPEIQYRGHRFIKGQVWLNYEFLLEDNSKIQINECPEVIHQQNKIGFERKFQISDIPKEVQLILEMDLSSVSSEDDIETNGNFEKLEVLEVSGSIPGKRIKGKLTLNDKNTHFAFYFTSVPMIKTKDEKGESAQEEEPKEHKLIAKSDCRTCHNISKPTVGPSYMEIARRYRTTDENINYLVNKIINGGSGNWGQAAMSSHPDLSEPDVKTIVHYILDLDKKEENSPELGLKEVPTDQLMKANKNISNKQFSNGILTKAYRYNYPVDRIADLKLNKKTPLYGGIMKNISMNSQEFADLTDNFALTFEGFLKIDESGTYVFRLISDDGSQLYINDKLIVDHDGKHGSSPKDSVAGLEKGYHPFKIVFFQGGGGRAIHFKWRKFSEDIFELVPKEIMMHDVNRLNEVNNLAMPLGTQLQRSGDGIPLASVHPAYDLSQARPNNFLPKVGGMDFLSDGRLVISTWDPTGAVYILSNVESGDHEKITVKLIANGLAEPLGLKVVDDQIYVLQKQELTHLIDHNGDEIIDEYRIVSNKWRVSANFHEFAFGLAYKEGYFYATLAIAILPGGASANPQIPDRGKVVKISKEDGNVEFIAHGLRTPNGIGIGVDNEIFVADNQGDWLPASKIVHVKKGAWFGSRSVDFQGTENLKETLPVVWLPQDEIGNSPSTPLYLNDGPYKGQMIHGEVTHGGIKRVFVEKISGQYQGALFRFSQGLEGGINRMVWGPDGALYVGCIGNPGNWQQEGKLWYGLQRMKYNGKSVFEMLAVRAQFNGLEIEFTQPLDWKKSNKLLNYTVQRWWYLPTKEYGGPKKDLKNLMVKRVDISPDRKKIFLILNVSDIKPNHVFYIRLKNIISDSGEKLFSTESWYTMNKIPEGDI